MRKIAIAAVLACAGAAWADAADQAKKDFADLFGKQVEQARKSPGTADNLALARQILASAKESTVSPELMTLLCDAAYELAMADPKGLDLATEAVELLARSVPAKTSVCQGRMIEIGLKRYASASSSQKSQIGQDCVDLLLEAAGGLGPTPAALGYLKSAEKIASQIGSGTLGAIRSKIQDQELRAEALKKAATLEAALKANPNDRATRDALIQLYLVELDQPADAKKLLQSDSEETLRTYVPLAAGAVDKVPGETCLELAAWYEGLSEKAGKLGTIATLRRAQGYYQRYLETHETKDASRMKAEMALAKVTEKLDKLAPAGGGWINLLRAINPQKHSRAGIWLWNSGALVLSKRAAYARVMAPVVPEGSYEMMMTYARVDGTNSARLILPLGKSSCLLTLGMTGGQICGLDRVLGEDPTKNATKTPAKSLAGDGKHTVYAKVMIRDQKVDITVKLDEKPLFTWSGSPSDLSRPGDWELTDSATPGIGINEARMAVFSLQMRMLSGHSKVVRTDEVAARRADEQAHQNNQGTGPRIPTWRGIGRTGGRKP